MREIDKHLDPLNADIYNKDLPDNLIGYGPLFEVLPEISWELTRYCNFHCSYCWQDHDGIWTSWEAMKMAIDEDLSKIEVPYEFSTFGGEPTLHPHYLKLIDYMQGRMNIARFAVMTNNSQTLDFWKAFSKSLKNADFTVRLECALHFEKADPIKWRENVEYLTDQGFETHGILLCHRDHFDEIRKLYDWLKDLNAVEFSVVRVDDHEHVLTPYTKEYDIWIREQQLKHQHWKNDSKRYYLDWRMPDGSVKREEVLYDDTYYLQESFKSIKGISCIHNSFYIYQDGYYRTICNYPPNRQLHNMFIRRNFHKFFNENLNHVYSCPHDICKCDIHPESIKWRDNI